jgi:hypothetical protein
MFCSPSKMICELMNLRSHCVGIYVIPFDYNRRILIFEGILFKLVKSLLITNENDSSVFNGRGKVKLI